MKKRLVSALLIATMVLTGLAGCGAEETVRRKGGQSCVSLKKDFSAVRDECTEEYVTEGLCYDNGYCVGLSYYNECGDIPFDTEEYSAITVNGFKKVSTSPLSTFSADVDTASYSNVRRFIENGYSLSDIPTGAVRTEELINYFNYDYKLPGADEPFGVTTEIGDCPWNSKSKLLSVGIKTEKIDFSDAAPSNIVFLIDVSGSMYDDNKLPLLKKSFKIMLDNLGEKDRISIVTYASGNSIVLEGTPASEKEKIESALDSLTAGGGTNGGEGIISAYQLAEQNFIKDGNNRVILATDGDLNIGITNESDLKDLITKKSKTGIFLTVLGFGMGNYSDSRLETLADAGNGNYAYIDTLNEAKKVLCEELGANMVTVAKDVKFQVEFNPAVVAEYRLLGYEDRELADEDFNDDTKDAGEIGAGHTVTALYEIVTIDEYEGTDPELKYQTPRLTDAATNTDEWLTVSIRYKEPDSDTSKLLSYPVGNADYTKENSDDFKWSVTVAEFAQILRHEEFVGDATLDTVLNKLGTLNLNDTYKEEFKMMVMRLITNA